MAKKKRQKNIGSQKLSSHVLWLSITTARGCIADNDVLLSGVGI